MTLDVRDSGDVTLLDLAGKLTLGDGVELLQETMQRLTAEGRTRIVINLEKVPYMDSAGIGELISCYKKSADAGGEVKLLNPLKRVYDVLHAVKLDAIFQIFKDESEALASF